MGTSLRMMRVIDSHTAGQPTRVIVEGGPNPGEGPLSERMTRLREQSDRFRSAVVGEPRGSDALVGALLVPPSDPTCTAGVIFFDNTAYFGMCGHGIIGLIATLEYLGMVKNAGIHRIETPAGIVTTELHPNGEISVQNVPSFRHRKDVSVDVNDSGSVTGDVAYGGNWFFLVDERRQELSAARIDPLTHYAQAIRDGLRRDRVTGSRGEPIDGVVLFGPPQRRGAQSRNFVLRFGKRYGRSPCGTGTSAKLACLFEDNRIKEGENWRQESILGTFFDGSVRVIDGAILPTIRGISYITSESMLIVDERDPLCWGLT